MPQSEDNRKRFQISDEDYREAQRLTGENDQLAIWHELVRSYKEYHFSRKAGQGAQSAIDVWKPSADYWKNVKLEADARTAVARAFTAEQKVGKDLEEKKRREEAAKYMKAASDHLQTFKAPTKVYCGKCLTFHWDNMPCKKDLDDSTGLPDLSR